MFAYKRTYSINTFSMRKFPGRRKLKTPLYDRRVHLVFATLYLSRLGFMILSCKFCIVNIFRVFQEKYHISKYHGTRNRIVDVDMIFFIQ